MAYQQQSTIHHGRGSEAKGIHFLLSIQPRDLQDEELMLPRNFVEKFWKDVPNPISLKLPNGFECKMKWVQRHNDIWLVNWKKFAGSLRCGDHLLFQYKCGSDFHVIILDDNKLEIDYSNIKCNDDQGFNKNCKQEAKESDDDGDCVEILNIATTSIDKRKIDMNATKQKVSVDEGAEATEGESSDDVATEGESSDESSYEDEMAKKARRTRKGKRKAGSNKVAMVKKARKYPTSETVNENPFFEITMSQTYANGYFLWIPTDFSREHLIDFNGTATIRVGNDMAVEVRLGFVDTQKLSRIWGGWILFNRKYNLQVDDVCKFEMIQRRPMSFNVTITRVKELLDIGGTPSGSRPKENCLGDSEGHNVMKRNTFKIYVNSLYPDVPNEFMKRGCHENFVELKIEQQSWFIKVNYYPSISRCRFSRGWKKFTEIFKVKIGDTCLLELIDKDKFVFKVSIVR